MNTWKTMLAFLAAGPIVGCAMPEGATPDDLRADYGSAAALSAEQVALAAKEAGVLCGEPLATAVAVSWAESKYYPEATGYNPPSKRSYESTDHGLWQINDYWHGIGRRAEWECGDIYNTACNATYMHRISSGGSDWWPWYTFRDGLHLAALPQARRAAETVCSTNTCADFEGRFSDDDESPHQAAIEELAALGITSGCEETPCPRFCPKGSLSRKEAASLLARTAEFPAPIRDWYVDDDGSPFEHDLNRLAEADVLLQCTWPGEHPTAFVCPDEAITRAEMAYILSRSLRLGPASADHFRDDGGSPYQDDINRVAEAGITLGCDAGTRAFCPERHVTRAEMATFLSRALKL